MLCLRCSGFTTLHPLRPPFIGLYSGNPHLPLLSWSYGDFGDRKNEKSFYVAAVVKASCVFSFPVFSGRCVTSPRAVSRLPWALAPRVSNDLLTVRVSTPFTPVSMRLLTTASRSMGGDPINTTACCAGPACQRTASTNTWAQT